MSVARFREKCVFVFFDTTEMSFLSLLHCHYYSKHISFVLRYQSFELNCL